MVWDPAGLLMPVGACEGKQEGEGKRAGTRSTDSSAFLEKSRGEISSRGLVYYPCMPRTQFCNTQGNDEESSGRRSRGRSVALGQRGRYPWPHARMSVRAHRGRGWWWTGQSRSRLRGPGALTLVVALASCAAQPSRHRPRSCSGRHGLRHALPRVSRRCARTCGKTQVCKCVRVFTCK